jgi:protein transport protein SEC61 subunit alpha
MSTETKKSNSFFSNPLRFIKPFVCLLPQVKAPTRTPSLREKFIWTALALLIYYVASQIPLYGISNTNIKDYSQWLKILMASSRGTLMDLGTWPVTTASTITNILLQSKLIEPDFSIKEDKILFDSFQKLISLVFTLGQAIVQIVTGYYGPLENLTKASVFMILFQLVISGLIVILLDELLQKGYGLGNGVNLFIIANVCERAVWNAISPKVFYTGRGIEFEGCLVAAVHLLFVRRNKFLAIKEILFRDNLPNLSSLIFSLVIFSFVVYIQTLRVELPILSRKHKGVVGSYPINLMYSSTNPILYQTTLFSLFFSCSRMIYKYFPKSIISKILGAWELKPKIGHAPISGLCYFIFPPSSYTDILTRPIFFILYCSIMLISSALISLFLLEGQEENSAAVFKRIKAQDMQLRGIRDNNAVEKLDEYINPAAFCSGFLTYFVVLFCDLFSVVGSGSNIFLGASIMNQYIKLIAKETAKNTGKAFIE